MRSAAILAFFFFLTGVPGLPAQERGQGDGNGASGPPAGPPAILVLPAVRVQGQALEIDGLLDEEVWRGAPVATDFIQLEPEEGDPATERTEVRVLYGEVALFVSFRAFDSSPDSIAAQLTRRDQDSYSDRVHVLIDSYFDRRTAFHFSVNPVGAKVDIYRFDDTEEDSSWDAVWEVGTTIDREGWTAEFRIPYSQLRFGNHEDQTWGINFAREIARKNETATWAPIRQSDAAIVSKFGQLRGLRDLGSPKRLELRPFSLAKVTRGPGEVENPFYQKTGFFSSAGLDLKYGLTNDLTLDVTVNPDFGQVEADPAQVNLTAFESFFPEQRPFFIEGAAIYNFSIGVGGGDLGSESLFYSRRIGRPPQGWVDPQSGYSDVPDASTIMGAWKLSGKTRGGWSIGLLHAVTAEEAAEVSAGGGPRFQSPVEPLSNYGVARIQKDFRAGKSAVGFIGTAANRDKGVADDLLLRSGAFAGGIDFRHRFAEDRYSITGYLLGSRVTGSEDAIYLTQRSPSRYFQRPDAGHTTLDPARTSLSGWAGNLHFGKIGGGFWNWGTLLAAKSPGFEPNDLGFQREADLLLHVGYFGYNHYTPSDRLRQWNISNSVWHGYTFGGERVATGFNTNGSVTLNSYWGARIGINHDFEVFSDGTLRGGPLIRRGPRTSGWLGFFSDQRKPVLVDWNNNWSVVRESDSWSLNTSLNVRWRPSGRANLSLGPFFDRTTNDLQWVERVSLDGEHFVFGRIQQKTAGLTGRVDFTFTPELTLQVYAQPFVSAGQYSDFKQVAEPRAKTYRDRFHRLDFRTENDRHWSDLDENGAEESFRNPDFNLQQFRSNVVLRWEYRPGSLLYLVWSQGRDRSTQDGRFDFEENLSNLFKQDAENVFMLKVSYWITP
ncbi:DUF5916 domain-containing protein [Gemmatimonadota bacterium]